MILGTNLAIRERVIASTSPHTLSNSKTRRSENRQSPIDLRKPRKNLRFSKKHLEKTLDPTARERLKALGKRKKKKMEQRSSGSVALRAAPIATSFLISDIRGKSSVRARRST